MFRAVWLDRALVDCSTLCRSSTGFLGFSAFHGSSSQTSASTSATAPAPSFAAPPSSSARRTAGAVVVAPVYSGEDSDLNVSFKRLTKKDSVTKLKALSELRELLPSRSKELVAGCLPYWSYIYPKLCMENDPRVREAAHVTFAELVRPQRVFYDACCTGV